MLRVAGRATEPALWCHELAPRVPVSKGVDWNAVDIGRLQGMRCPACHGALAGGLMRQVEATARRCVVVVSCPGCGAESLAILEDRPGRPARAPIDVDDVRSAHELLASHDWRVSELFAA